MDNIKNVVSLFDGISCARVALDVAKCTVEHYYALEIDKYAHPGITINVPFLLAHQSIRYFVHIQS